MKFKKLPGFFVNPIVDMDPLSQGHSMDDGLPQPTVFDLSRRGCLSPVDSSPVGALHVARVRRWGENSSRGVEITDSSAAYSNSLSAQQVQSDNAFSNTTVTLSYISRPHVHSNQDQISPRVHSFPSQLDGLDAKGHRLAIAASRGRGGCWVEASNRLAGGLASQSEHFRLHTEAPQKETLKSGRGEISRYVEENPGFNGKHGPTGPASHQHRPDDCIAQGGGRFSQHRGGNRISGVQNGVKGSFWDSESGKRKCSSLQKGVEPSQCGEESSKRSKRTSRKLYSSLNEDFMSPPDESPSSVESSSDETGSVSSSAQSLNSSCSESSDPEDDIADVPIVKSAEEEGCRFTVQFVEVSSSSEDSYSDDSDVIEVPITNTSALSIAGLKDPFRKSPLLERCPSEKKQLTHTTKQTELKVLEDCVNRSTNGDKRAVRGRKQPTHARLAAVRPVVVLGNVFPCGSKSPFQTQFVEKCTEPKTVADLPAVMLGGTSDGDSAKREADHPNLLSQQEDLCSTWEKSRQFISGSEDGSISKSHDSSTPSPGPASLTETELRQPGGSLPLSCLQKGLGNKIQPKGRSKRSRTSRKVASKSSSTKKRKKCRRVSQPSMFSLQEPEIKLKYATYKEEKRDTRAFTFAPYVHLENKNFSTCTVINYPEEETGRLKKGQLRQMGHGLATGLVPNTSYLELGRLDAEQRRGTNQVCCLCGGVANAVDLGDLHGPYRPRKGQPGPRILPEPQDLLEQEAGSDSDSSYDGQRVKFGRVQEETVQPHRLSLGPKREAALTAQCRWVSDEDSLQGPFAKTSQAMCNHSDQHSALSEALGSSEFWVHEDCIVWSMDVFLVKGRLYGLEEAVRLAQRTVCSACHEQGATLGCFFKGCPNKYHYRCALQSDCVLNEENFTMKCKRHKNKSLKGVSRTENRLNWNISLLTMPVPSLAVVAMTMAGMSVELRAWLPSRKT
ncbi:hypothetical protein GJAV_G00220020 [Gymnothorax javanicus]|nr:hypothetical protein GJAV_G00220020 [Gymnothorax javanicus]